MSGTGGHIAAAKPSASSSKSDEPLATAGKNAHRRKGQGKDSALSTSDDAAAPQANAEEDLSRAQVQAEAARKARQESSRLAQERIAVARRELQLGREREEARERERAVARRRRQKEEWAQESVMTIQQVVGSSFIKFGAGLTIQHVICGFEASRVLVKNLPRDAKPTEVLELFTQQGIAEEDLVILSTDIVGGSQQATILGKAVDFDTVVTVLDGVKFRGQSPIEFVVCECLSQGRTMGVSIRNSHHLTVSWRHAFLTMLAHYPHLGPWEMSQKAQELDRGLLDGQRVRAMLHWEQQSTDDSYDFSYPRTSQQTIKIIKISNTTTV